MLIDLETEALRRDILRRIDAAPRSPRGRPCPRQSGKPLTPAERQARWRANVEDRRHELAAAQHLEWTHDLAHAFANQQVREHGR